MSNSQIRNFAIIAHVDHGKSTLADRFLEITRTIEKRDFKPQYLDSNPIERERGITIKLAPVRMLYTPIKSAPSSAPFILNLIDTPGHVDFSYEVNRSLAACEGAILLVDATQGIQAQTTAHFHEAQKLGLKVIPAVNKIDAPSVDVASTLSQIEEAFGFQKQSVSLVSGKTGEGVLDLLDRVTKEVPPPSGSPENPLKALVFNSNFDRHQGVIAWIRVIDGVLKPATKIFFLANQVASQAVEVGIFAPHQKITESLSSGEVGFVTTTLKDISALAVGNTLINSADIHNSITLLPGYQPVQPVVFIGLYPIDGSEVKRLGDALGKLKLSDSSLEFQPEASPALGSGYRVGLLGVLHADIVQERLEREFNLELIATSPSVSFEIESVTGETSIIHAPEELPDISTVRQIREPMVVLTLMTPQASLGSILELCQHYRASLQDMKYLGELVKIVYHMPFAELVRGFYDRLKSVSSGFATLDYQLIGYQAQDLVKLDILLAGEKIDVLSQIVHRDKAIYLGRELTSHLKEVIPRQQFEISIQAAIGAKIVAREDVKAFRKDVTEKLYGGDQTRKDKLLKKQKKGKKRMKRVGKIDLPQEALLSILKI